MNSIQKLVDKIDNADLWENDLVLSRNEYLKVEGSIDTNIYYVKKGSLRVYVLDEYEEHTIRFGYKNNFIAALDSFLTENPSDLYIQALRETQLYVVGKEKLVHFMNASPENLQLWRNILELFIRQQMERERDLLTSSPIKRYKRVLKRSPQLFQEIPHKYIASYLRMAPETLSRLKKS